jgi:hypothetical protein
LDRLAWCWPGAALYRPGQWVTVCEESAGMVVWCQDDGHGLVYTVKRGDQLVRADEDDIDATDEPADAEVAWTIDQNRGRRGAAGGGRGRRGKDRRTAAGVGS